MQKKTINFQRLHTQKAQQLDTTQNHAFEKILRLINSLEWEDNLFKLKEINFNTKETLAQITPDQKSELIVAILKKDTDWKKKLTLLESMEFSFNELSNQHHYEIINSSFYTGKQIKCNQNSVYEKLSYLQTKAIHFRTLTSDQQYAILIENLPNRIEKIIKFLQLKEHLNLQMLFSNMSSEQKFELIRENLLQNDFKAFLEDLAALGLTLNNLTSAHKSELIKSSLKTHTWREFLILFNDMNINYSKINLEDQNDIIKSTRYKSSRAYIVTYLQQHGFTADISVIPTSIKTLFGKIAKS